MAKTRKPIAPKRPRSNDVAGCLAIVWVAIGLVLTAAVATFVGDYFNLFRKTVPAAVKPVARTELARPAMPSGGGFGSGIPAPGIGPGGGGSPPQEAALSPRLPAPPSGTPPWLGYAVPAPPHSGPVVAVVIDDMGLDRRRSGRATALPGPLTLAFMPYAEDLAAQTAMARQHGHELLVHMPMEATGGNDAGPQALEVRLAPDEIERRLLQNLGRFQGFVGINNHMGSRFTAYRPGMEVVIATLRARGLLWLDSRTTADTVGPALAAAYQVPSASRDVFLDDVTTVAAVRKQLKELETIAHRRGEAIAIGHPKDATLEALAGWLTGLRREGLTLVPVSAIVRNHNGKTTH